MSEQPWSKNGIILEGVKEYDECYAVELGYYDYGDDKDKLCVRAYNEGGYNGVSIDAKQLYEALKKYFEGKEEK